MEAVLQRGVHYIKTQVSPEVLVQVRNVGIYHVPRPGAALSENAA